MSIFIFGHSINMELSTKSKEKVYYILFWVLPIIEGLNLIEESDIYTTQSNFV